jgi:glycosyltransferase involved in cell wall biosynthesis
VHQGGGKSLLIALLEAVPSNVHVLALLDSRMTLPANLPDNLATKFVAPSIRHRLQAAWWLKCHVKPQDTILCFGNLPPIFKIEGHVIVFVQNRYLVDDVRLDGFPTKVKLRIGVERFWLSGRISNTDEFIVQTASMEALLKILIKNRKPIHVLPFIGGNIVSVQRAIPTVEQKQRQFEFVYVASGEPHKNHRQLIEAWCLLAEKGFFPSLKLTLDRADFAELCLWIDRKTERYQLNVNNLGHIPSEDITMLYSSVDALIYPSKFESFGLPLIQARQANLPVLASELDYVRDVLDPEQAFDPESAVSIARAVKRFMGIEEPTLPLLDARGFMKQILIRSE